MAQRHQAAKKKANKKEAFFFLSSGGGRHRVAKKNNTGTTIKEKRGRGGGRPLLSSGGQPLPSQPKSPRTQGRLNSIKLLRAPPLWRSATILLEWENWECPFWRKPLTPFSGGKCMCFPVKGKRHTLCCNTTKHKSRNKAKPQQIATQRYTLLLTIPRSFSVVYKGFDLPHRF